MIFIAINLFFSDQKYWKSVSVFPGTNLPRFSYLHFSISSPRYVEKEMTQREMKYNKLESELNNVVDACVIFGDGLVPEQSSSNAWTPHEKRMKIYCMFSFQLLFFTVAADISNLHEMIHIEFTVYIFTIIQH